MIITKIVLVTLQSKNANHFESLGYNISKRLFAGKLRFIRGTSLQVKVSDLPLGSRSKILCKCDGCGKEIWMTYNTYNRILKFGKYFCNSCTHSTKEFISKSPILGKIGKESPNWNNDLTEKERNHCVSGITKWKKEVKERDNYTCQKCGSKEHLSIHHINNFRNFKEQRTDINNGITLCFECHQAKNGKSIHSIFGKLTTKEHLEEFLIINL